MQDSVHTFSLLFIGRVWSLNLHFSLIHLLERILGAGLADHTLGIRDEPGVELLLDPIIKPPRAAMRNSIRRDTILNL